MNLGNGIGKFTLFLSKAWARLVGGSGAGFTSMNETDPYLTLGIREDAPFEDIQAAKARLLLELDEYDQQRQVIEAAYDAILMRRLQMRKEGKVKVPDRIRFPETIPPAQSIRVKAQTPVWWQDWVEPPLPNQIWMSLGIFGGLFGLSLLPSFGPTLVLALALMIATYLFLQKNRNLFRSLGLSLGTLVIAYLLTSLVGFGPASATVGVAGILVAYLAATCYLK